MATFNGKELAGTEKENVGLVTFQKKLHEKQQKLAASAICPQDVDPHVGSYGRKRIAEERGQIALSALRERQLKDNEERATHFRARQKVQQMERDRAQFIASLPAPAKERRPSPEIEKHVGVYNSDFNVMGICQIPLRRGIVQKANPDSEVDARAAAVAYEEKSEAKGKARAAEEAKLKARTRHREALKKEKISQDYNSVMKELDRHQRATAFFPRKKCHKSKKIESTVSKSGERQESALEKAVESVIRETDDVDMDSTSFANVTIRKKKKARLSVGKQRTTKTSKGTLATKQTALGSFLSRLRSERRRSSSLRSRTSSVNSSNLSKAFSDTRASSVLDGAVRSMAPVPVVHKHLVLPCSPLMLEPVTIEPQIIKQAMPLEMPTKKDSSTQTRLTFHPNSLGGWSTPSSPSISSYRSWPSGFGQSPTAVQILGENPSRETQTPGDILTMYQKYLLSRAKRSASSTSQSSLRTPSEGGSTSTSSSLSSSGSTLSRDLSSYIRQLATKHFPSPGDPVTYFVTPTRTVSVENTNHSAAVECRTTEATPSSRNIVNRERPKVASPSNPPVLHSPLQPQVSHYVPRAPNKKRTNSEQRLIARTVSTKTSGSKVPVLRKESRTRTYRTYPTITIQGASPPNESASSEQQEMMISLSPPITLTLTSPESTLVVHLSGPEESGEKSPETSAKLTEEVSSGGTSRSISEQAPWVPQPFIAIPAGDRVTPMQHGQDNRTTIPYFKQCPTNLSRAATTVDSVTMAAPSSPSRFTQDKGVSRAANINSATMATSSLAYHFTRDKVVSRAANINSATMAASSLPYHFTRDAVVSSAANIVDRATMAAPSLASHFSRDAMVSSTGNVIDSAAMAAPSSASRFNRDEMDTWLPASLTSGKSLLHRLPPRTVANPEKPLAEGTPEGLETSSFCTNLPTQSAEEMESIMSMLLTKDDYWKQYRPRPPSSLPFGFRQFLEPHELSTISEIDTPHTSIQKDVSLRPGDKMSTPVEIQCDVNSPGSSSSLVTLTPVSRLGSETNTPSIHIPLWEQILSSEKCYSPRLLSRCSPNRIPSQSTPVRDEIGYVPEFEEGVLEHSFISLIGSEVTINDRRVPDMDQSFIPASSPASNTLFTLTPLTPNKNSPYPASTRGGPATASSLRGISDSHASFLRHELSCANETDGSGTCQ